MIGIARALALSMMKGASRSMTNSTAMRVPLITGFPARILGSWDIRSRQFMIELYDVDP